MGFKELIIPTAGSDTLFMQEQSAQLPEVVVESRHHKLLHILAYVREYSSLTTYSDTVTMYREKMVDYMLTPEGKRSFKGWTTPRILASKSYYHFTNSAGLDSVSDRCNLHFSWADWVGIAPSSTMPQSLCSSANATDTIRGKYSPTEIWLKRGDKVTLDVNVMADTASRKWVPNLGIFFRRDIDFEQFKVRFNYCDVVDDRILPTDLTGYSFNIESNGRGHSMFMFHRPDEPFYVSTYGEVYVIEKEYITEKEAKKWRKIDSTDNKIDIYQPAEVPDLQPSIAQIIDRVNFVNHDLVRQALTPDQRLAGRSLRKLNFGQHVLQRLKGIFGIAKIVAPRKWNRQWNDFRETQKQHNQK